MTLSYPDTTGCGCPALTLLSGSDLSQTRIASGIPLTSISQQPWDAVVELSFGYNDLFNGIKLYFFTATIISEFFLLTGGHVLAGQSAPRVSVRYGTLLRQVCGYSQSAAAIYVHPEFGLGKPVHKDIGLVRVSKAIQFSASVQPAILASPEDIPGQLFISGWGSSNDYELMGLCLREGNVLPVSFTSCQATFSVKNLEVEFDMICVGLTGHTGCGGDSGGPLIDKITRIIYGIISWGGQCGNPNEPTVCTSVVFHREYIKSITGF